MSDPVDSRCQACGSPREEVRKLIAVGGPVLCDKCIQRYSEALKQAYEEDSRARAELSPLVAAEEMALNLIDQLEASRAQHEQEQLLSPLERRPLLKLIQFDEAPVADSSEETESEEKEQEQEPIPLQPPVAVITAREEDLERQGLDGRPLAQHAAERCRASGVFSEVIVATPDPRVAEAAMGWGIRAQLIPDVARSLLEQLAEVARSREEPAGFVGVTSERLFSSELFSTLVSLFEDPQVDIATAVRPLSEAERANPDIVKVVLGQNGEALYFSRADLPAEREGAEPVPRYVHLPVLAYRRSALLALAQQSPSPLEQLERHEPLRALEHGFRIRCLVAP